MNEEIARLLGINPQQAQSDALNRAFISGLLQVASLSGPQRQPVGTAPALAQAVLGGMGAYESSIDKTLKDALTGLQMRNMIQQQQERERMREAIRGAYTMQPTAQGVMATQSNIDPGLLEGMSAQQVIAAAPKTERVVDRQKLLSAVAEFAPEKYLELTQPKEGKETFRPMTDQEKKAFGLPTDRSYQISSSGKVDEIGKGPLVQVMGEGQKGLDNEMKIRSAFSGEPVYKAYQEMRSAYGQITDSLRQESPAGDLAAATKFMKLLDPGSVVRESELYMAMKASGALDRFVNYANMRINGTSLTPTQRKDFQALADQLFSTAANTYNTKRNEYAELATQYKLNPDRAVGAPATIARQDTSGSIIDQVRAEMKRRGL